MVKHLHTLQDISTAPGGADPGHLPHMFSLAQYRALHEGAGLVERSHRGRLRLSGADRRDYLQGLLTNDIAGLSPGTGCYAALLTAQGRMISDMSLAETGSAIVMDLERAVTGKVFAHLERFIITEDVQVTDETESVAQIGVFGPEASTVVSRVIGVDASGLESHRPFDNRTWQWNGVPVLGIRRDDIGVPGFDLLIGIDRAGSLSQAVRDQGALEVDPDVVEVSRVEAGRPIFGRDMTEETIPLEAGIEDRAISFTKGCYVGQEIIIRVLHRGHGRVARRLVGLTMDPAAEVPAAGDRVRSAERDIGTVTSAVRSVALDRPIAMAYVQRDFAEPSTEVSVVSRGALVPGSVVPLPFTSTARFLPSA
jgi:folate-binding protein YgfZ